MALFPSRKDACRKQPPSLERLHLCCKGSCEFVESSFPTAKKSTVEKNFLAKADTNVYRDYLRNQRRYRYLDKAWGTGDHPLLGCREGGSLACCLLFV
jgi:hypothetical protein